MEDPKYTVEKETKPDPVGFFTALVTLPPLAVGLDTKNEYVVRDKDGEEVGRHSSAKSANDQAAALNRR